MKLLNLESGQSAQLFAADEVYPREGIYFPNLVQELKERYGFVVAPDIGDAIGTGHGLKFLHGRLIRSDTINILSLQLFNDGVIVTCLDTEAADVVLDDVILLAKSSFKFREPQTIQPRRYVSTVVVSFEKDIDSLVRGFESVSENFARALAKCSNIKANIHVGRIAFRADPLLHLPHTNTDLLIERRVGRPFADNVYYSGAPLTSKAHLELLERIEDIAANQPG